MKKIYYILTLLLCVYVQTVNAQMGVNSTGAVPATSAMLDVSSISKGFLPPRMNTTQRTGIASPATGLMVFDTDLNELYVRVPGLWRKASQASVPLVMSGNDGSGVIQGYSTGSGYAIYGYSSSNYGVLGGSSTGSAVRGISGSGSGVEGTSTSGIGVYATSSFNSGIEGYATNPTPTTHKYGVLGRNMSSNGFGYGLAGIHDGSGEAVWGYSNQGNGILAETSASAGTFKAAVKALGNATVGVWGTSNSDAGVLGQSSSGIGVKGSGNQGVSGDGTATGVFGTTSTGTGVFGRSDTFRGVWGRGITTGDGVYGDATTGNAIRGEASSSGTGGYFRSVTGEAIDASTGNNFAIRADNNSSSLATGSFANIGLGTAVKIIGGASALEITGGIKVSGNATNKAAFKIITNTAVGGNTTSNELKIPNTTLANSATDILIVTHNSVPISSAFIILNKAFGVYWDNSSWNIFLEDMTAMPNNVTFNVLVIKQ